MKFAEVIELLRKRQGFTSHEQVAEYLDMSRGGYFNMLNGRGGLKDPTIGRIMEGTNLEAHEIEAAWKAQYARDKRVRNSYKKMAISLLFLLLFSSPALASAISVMSVIVYYVKSHTILFPLFFLPFSH